jgi:hypothetical protein
MKKSANESMNPWAEATEAYLNAAKLYAETMQACWKASAEAVIEMTQSGREALPEPEANKVESSDAASDVSASVAQRVRSLTSTSSKTTTSWYRPPVENPVLSLIDDAMKPWRTMIPDYSGHPQHLTEADLFSPKGAAEIMAAYQSGSGFSMAQISFPDEKSISVTLPAPWAMLTKS